MSSDSDATNSRRPPPGHSLVPTSDGSFTLHSERFDENCHSTAGALEETRLHYLEGCQVERLLQEHAQVAVLEVGFATGLGWRLTQELAARYPKSRLTFVSLELDEELIQWAEAGLEKTLHKGVVTYRKQVANSTLTVLAGDARHTLPAWAMQFPTLFHAIYQDAFSPKKNPTLWTVEWFRELGSVAAVDCLMSTYSASVSIRKAMLEAGWGLSAGEKFGPKKTSTRARWQAPSDLEILQLLARSPTPALKDSPA